MNVNRFALSEPKKSIIFMREPASGPLRGTAGRGDFFIFILQSAAGAPRRGRRHSSHLYEMSGNNSCSISG